MKVTLPKIPMFDHSKSKMLFISHRGNVNGPMSQRYENNPKIIEKVIRAGYLVEVDLQIHQGKPYLGHDEPFHKVTRAWIEKWNPHLFFHAKTREAVEWIYSGECLIDRWFFHEQEKYTLVSDGSLWTHDLTKPPLKHSIVPLISFSSVKEYPFTTNFEGICTDWIEDAVERFYPHNRIDA